MQVHPVSESGTHASDSSLQVTGTVPIVSPITRMELLKRPIAAHSKFLVAAPGDSIDLTNGRLLFSVLPPSTNCSIAPRYDVDRDADVTDVTFVRLSSISALSKSTSNVGLRSNETWEPRIGAASVTHGTRASPSTGRPGAVSAPNPSAGTIQLRTASADVTGYVSIQAFCLMTKSSKSARMAAVKSLYDRRRGTPTAVGISALAFAVSICQ